MGAECSQQKCRCGGDKGELNNVDVGSTLQFIPEPLENDEVRDPAFEGLQGHWYRQEDNLHVGEVAGRHIIWHVHWKMPEYFSDLEILPRDPDDISGSNIQIKIQLGKHMTIGEVHADAQVAIHWEDGDIWLRK
ncbi:unnamed protein product [Symbiodinium pilosum]|uniref:Uncharacterized protein n=1 Tax=Symbiodinium pilosum TaxID=2952 RepID=A0A812J6W7_SYMPI|nr:unnamed protein product [Symbiodinium pilosum]